ncbi:GTP cyclohydrolase II [Aquibacillus saliphilus]|uniref:GTP cyclohydrolase II n=1 Tax=Aquibacillus saliphilus TaxID=1909422 RepID=UPI001CF0B177|nr:GTP cyclohydrolase II [Aquibacillus saliphilus]
MAQSQVKSEVLNVLADKLTLVRQNEGAIYLVGPIRLPVNLDGKTVVLKWYCWLNHDEIIDDYEELLAKIASADLAEFQQSSVLVYGDFAHGDEAMVRMHSTCHTGDIFGSKRCDCGFQLKESMKKIVTAGAGALFYLANHEGRGIGLFSKAMAYILQENGYDTVEANNALGFVDDSRDYKAAIDVLKSLRSKPVSIITNNPKKIEALKNAGLDLVDRVPLWDDNHEYNEKYLQTKIKKSGHIENSENSVNV